MAALQVTSLLPQAMTVPLAGPGSRRKDAAPHTSLLANFLPPSAITGGTGPMQPTLAAQVVLTPPLPPHICPLPPLTTEVDTEAAMVVDMEATTVETMVDTTVETTADTGSVNTALVPLSFALKAWTLALSPVSPMTSNVLTPCLTSITAVDVLSLVKVKTVMLLPALGTLVASKALAKYITVLKDTVWHQMALALPSSLPCKVLP